MSTKFPKKLIQLPLTLLRVLLSLLVLAGLVAVMTAAVALIASGMTALPAGAVRLIGIERIFVSDFSALTMTLFGAGCLLLGVGLILLCAVKLCPLSAGFVYRLFSRRDEK